MEDSVTTSCRKVTSLRGELVGGSGRKPSHSLRMGRAGADELPSPGIRLTCAGESSI